MTEQTFVRLRSKTTQEWFVDPSLRERMVAEAAERETSLTDLAVQILAEELGVPYTPNLRRSKPELDQEQIVFQMPEEVGHALRVQYRRPQDGIRKIWSKRYGLPVPERRPQERKPRAAPAPA